jgi:hypothetical protein
MNNLIKGITYSYNRNIGWQDRTIRTIVGIAATVGAIYFLSSNITYSILLGDFSHCTIWDSSFLPVALFAISQDSVLLTTVKRKIFTIKRYQLRNSIKTKSHETDN